MNFLLTHTLYAHSSMAIFFDKAYLVHPSNCETFNPSSLGRCGLAPAARACPAGAWRHFEVGAEILPAEPQEEEREEVILPPRNLVRQVAAEAGQALQRLVDFIEGERRWKPTEARALGNDVGVSDVAFLGISEGFLECPDRRGLKA